MESTLERINPDEIEVQGSRGQDSLRLHMERYRFAGENILPGIVADIACGTGYGSGLLADEYGHKITRIYAVDNDQKSIEFAGSRYLNDKIVFEQRDALAFNPPEKLNSIISLETIEHLPDPRKFVLKMSDLLVDKGRFIASVPITPSMDANPFHLHDFTIKSFINMFRQAGFRELHSITQTQTYHPFRLVAEKGERMKDVRKNIFAYYLVHPSKLFLRFKSLMSDGFRNKYLVTVFEKS